PVGPHAFADAGEVGAQAGVVTRLRQRVRLVWGLVAVGAAVFFHEAAATFDFLPLMPSLRHLLGLVAEEIERDRLLGEVLGMPEDLHLRWLARLPHVLGDQRIAPGHKSHGRLIENLLAQDRKLEAALYSCRKSVAIGSQDPQPAGPADTEM